VKYVIFKSEVTGQPIVTTFSHEVTHAYIAKAMNVCTRGYRIYSAGFYRLTKEGVVVEAEVSESLKLGPKPDDLLTLTGFFAGLTSLDMMNLHALTQLNSQKEKRA